MIGSAASITFGKSLFALQRVRRAREVLAFSPFASSRAERPQGERGFFRRPIRYAVSALLVFVLGTTASAAGTLQAMKKPVPASAFMLRDLNGKLVSFGDFEGKVVLLNFWATWCPPCRKEMPSMEQLYQTYGAEGFVVVGVSVDQGAPEAVKAFAEKLKITFPVLHDRDSIISRLYSNPGVPSSYLIDRRGMVVYRALGEYDWFSPEARGAVKALLNGTSKNSEE